MADIKKLMLEEIQKSKHIQTSSLDESEVLIDTGLEKNDENLTAVSVAYLDEKGYRRTGLNLDFAKQKILELSKDYDTIIIQQKRVEETDLFEKATTTELRDALEVCLVSAVSEIFKDVDRMAEKHYEYKTDYVEAIYLEKDRPKGSRLGMEEFESLDEKLNRYASEGWELDKMHNEPKGTKVFLIFKREKME